MIDDGVSDDTCSFDLFVDFTGTRTLMKDLLFRWYLFFVISNTISTGIQIRYTKGLLFDSYFTFKLLLYYYMPLTEPTLNDPF